MTYNDNIGMTYDHLAIWAYIINLYWRGFIISFTTFDYDASNPMTEAL